jgi:hypothetical protein
MLLVAREWNSPSEISARDWNILQPVPESAKHFVSTRSGLNEVWIGGKEVLEPLLESA